MSSIGEMTSKSSDDPSRHPIQASESSLGVADIDPGAPQEVSFFSRHSLGPEEIAARMTEVAPHGKQEDDGTYVTNKYGIPCPDSAHSKNVGGVLMANDPFLLEIMLTFNRSQTQGRKKLLYSSLSLFFVVS